MLHTPLTLPPLPLQAGRFTVTGRLTVVYDPDRASPFCANSNAGMSGLDDMATFLSECLKHSALPWELDPTLYGEATLAVRDERERADLYR